MRETTIRVIILLMRLLYPCRHTPHSSVRSLGGMNVYYMRVVILLGRMND